jgi:hypothetical protein
MVELQCGIKPTMMTGKGMVWKPVESRKSSEGSDILDKWTVCGYGEV